MTTDWLEPSMKITPPLLASQSVTVEDVILMVAVLLLTSTTPPFDPWPLLISQLRNSMYPPLVLRTSLV